VIFDHNRRVCWVACRIPFEHTAVQSELPAVGLIPACLNTSMIDPRKATKGRRMSKKTRKKSPKSPTGKTIRAPSLTKAKGPSPQSRRQSAAKTSKNREIGQAGSSVPKGSHEPRSKPLKSAGVAKTVNPSPGKTGSAKVAGPAVAEGADAPSFCLPRDGGGSVSLADYTGKKLVVFFYPRADTPGCTREAIDFTRLSGTFAECGTAVLGVSADRLEAQEAFRNKHRLSVPLGSDEAHEMLRAYGAWGEKSMYGRTFQGIRRTTVLIGRDGKILKIWRNVRVDGHADEVLAAAQAA
jgi:thioredoxin-dependent peroxiredoxin